MKKSFFRPKLYGYGFTPCSAEGWLATLVLLGMILFSACLNNIFSEFIAQKDVLRFIFEILIVTMVFSNWAEKRTDGELKWRWGK